MDVFLDFGCPLLHGTPFVYQLHKSSQISKSIMDCGSDQITSWSFEGSLAKGLAWLPAFRTRHPPSPVQGYDDMAKWWRIFIENWLVLLHLQKRWWWGELLVDLSLWSWSFERSLAKGLVWLPAFETPFPCSKTLMMINDDAVAMMMLLWMTMAIAMGMMMVMATMVMMVKFQ